MNGGRKVMAGGLKTLTYLLQHKKLFHSLLFQENKKGGKKCLPLLAYTRGFHLWWYNKFNLLYVCLRRMRCLVCCCFVMMQERSKKKRNQEEKFLEFSFQLLDMLISQLVPLLNFNSLVTQRQKMSRGEIFNLLKASEKEFEKICF